MTDKDSDSSSSLYPEVGLSKHDSHSVYERGNSSPSIYPSIDSSINAEKPGNSNSCLNGSSNSLYPSLDMNDLVENLFPENVQEDPSNSNSHSPSAPPECVEESLIIVPGCILHLVDAQYSIELACGELNIVCLRQGDTVLAVLARIGNEIQWPLTKDEASVKLDDSHYFFSLRVPTSNSPDSNEGEISRETRSMDIVSYGLTVASKGQEKRLEEFDIVLEKYSSFSVEKLTKKDEVLDGSMAKEISPSEMETGPKKELMEKRSAAYWTTLAPNVEDYSGLVAKAIALGSGQLIRGILWCGDVTVDRLKWGNELLKNRITGTQKAEISPEAIKRLKRVKQITKMSEKVATGVLSGVVKVTGFFTSSVVNSKVGKKFFGLLPGEIVLASLDGFERICDAVEVAGKNVLSTSSVVTTGLVSHRYGDQAATLASEGLDAAGHAFGTAWAVFKIRKGLNPKSVLKASTLAKSAAKAAVAEAKGKKSK